MPSRPLVNFSITSLAHCDAVGERAASTPSLALKPLIREEVSIIGRSASGKPTIVRIAPAAEPGLAPRKRRGADPTNAWPDRLVEQLGKRRWGAGGRRHFHRVLYHSAMSGAAEQWIKTLIRRTRAGGWHSGAREPLRARRRQAPSVAPFQGCAAPSPAELPAAAVRKKASVVMINGGQKDCNQVPTVVRYRGTRAGEACVRADAPASTPADVPAVFCSVISWGGDVQHTDPQVRCLRP